MSEEMPGPIAHSPQCIHRTALFLAYMAYRAMIDDDPSPQAAAMAAKIPAIMKQNWIDGLELDAAEERFINAPLGALIPQQRIEASWLIERMAVLAWAIGTAELPPFFTK